MLYDKLIIRKSIKKNKERGRGREKHFLYYAGFVLKNEVSSIMKMVYDKLIIRREMKRREGEGDGTLLYSMQIY
jgi:hypothetical protein